MATLSEEMIVMKYRNRPMKDLTQVNLWGLNLMDVSLVRRMPKIEILVLTQNVVESLRDIQFLENLTRLVVRGNKIQNLNEILYLKNLKHLRSLWLEGNPCAIGELYRPTVINTLPQLTELDQKVVNKMDRETANSMGYPLEHPAIDLVSQEEEYVVNTDNSAGILKMSTDQEKCSPRKGSGPWGDLSNFEGMESSESDNYEQCISPEISGRLYCSEGDSEEVQDSASVVTSPRTPTVTILSPKLGSPRSDRSRDSVIAALEHSDFTCTLTSACRRQTTSSQTDMPTSSEMMANLSQGCGEPGIDSFGDLSSVFDCMSNIGDEARANLSYSQRVGLVNLFSVLIGKADLESLIFVESLIKQKISEYQKS